MARKTFTLLIFLISSFFAGQVLGKKASDDLDKKVQDLLQNLKSIQKIHEINGTTGLKKQKQAQNQASIADPNL